MHSIVIYLYHVYTYEQRRIQDFKRMVALYYHLIYNITKIIPQVVSGEHGVSAASALPCEGRYNRN